MAFDIFSLCMIKFRSFILVQFSILDLARSRYLAYSDPRHPSKADLFRSVYYTISSYFMKVCLSLQSVTILRAVSLISSLDL